MDKVQRRSALKLLPNPEIRLDYVVVLTGDLGKPEDLTVIRYVPDRHLIDPESLYAYLETMASLTWESLEEKAAAVLDDVANEVVPRWLQVVMQTGDPCRHGVILEEKQPGWSNPGLLSRLKPI